MREANLDASEQRRHAAAVDGQVGEVVGDDGRRRHGRLEHADEGVAIEGLDDLLLHTRVSLSARHASWMQLVELQVEPARGVCELAA